MCRGLVKLKVQLLLTAIVLNLKRLLKEYTRAASMKLSATGVRQTITSFLSRFVQPQTSHATA